MNPIFAGRTASWPNAAVVFARYLDLSALGSRRRGLVRCIFHGEKTASLSVDLDAGVFNCFGCGEQGGIKRFAELVGEAPTEHRQPQPTETHLQEARRLAMKQEHQRRTRMVEWAPYLSAMRWLRAAEHLMNLAE